MLKDTKLEIEKVLNVQFPENTIKDKKIQEIVDRYSFESQTKRKKGEENTSSFLRKGISGDWENYFNEEAKDIFKKHAGQMLIQLGYEKDMNW